MTIRWTMIAAALAGAPATARAAEPPAAAAAAPVPLEALAQVPAIADPLISPDGRRILTRVNSNGQEALALYDRTLGPDQTPVFIDHVGTIRSLAWAGNDRVLINTTLVSLVLGMMALHFGQLQVFDLPTKKTLRLEAASALLPDPVVYIDPDGQYVLAMTQRDFGAPAVQRIDLTTGKGFEVQRHKEGVWRWFADGTGTIRGGYGFDGSNWTIYRRDAATGDLRRTVSGRLDKNRESSIEAIKLLPSSEGGIALSNERTGRFGVYKFDFRAQALGDAIFEHPQADVTSAELSPDGSKVEAVYYEDDKPRVVWFSPELQQVQAQIDRTFPGKVNRILNYSRDHNVVMVWTGSADDPGTYYVFDRKAKRMNAFAAPYDALIDRKLGSTAPITYKARDGLDIPGYLTLPPGRPAKGLPLVLMPHGGPFARAHYDFDPTVQMLATRGYAVLQPNFRGSTGFGRDFVEKGYGQWGTAMQDDLDDGVAWLAAQGIVDPKRVCIVGGSYGGYAALWGAIRNGDRYRCAVSFAGVADIRAMLKYDGGQFFESRYSKQWRKRVEGEEKRDLASVSPLQQQQGLAIPVLVAHGEMDTNVPVSQSKQLVAALRARGAAVQAAFYPREGHGFSYTADRLDYLRRVATFLEVHNPADGAPAAGPREAELIGGRFTATGLLSLAGKKKPPSPISVRLKVSADGRVTGCTVEKPSGSGAVDKAACPYAQELQFRPALGPDGKPQEASVVRTVSFEEEPAKTEATTKKGG